MKILYYNCFAGISGDMNLAALIDLGVPKEYILGELKKLNVSGYKIDISSQLKMGISGTQVTVNLTQDDSHEHTHSHGHHHIHRNIKDIEKIINSSSLPAIVKTKSLEIFHHIGVAEAKIHAKNLDEIHFHEVGAIDSIIDIVGAAICIDYLKPDRIISSTIELGGGFVNCAHGKFPVPAPATSEILSGIPVHMGTVNKETTTPTGAAILKTFVDEFTDQHEFIPEKTAYGIGHRDLDIPNVLRVFWGKYNSGTRDELDTSEAIMLECNIDDMNPEHYDYIMGKAFAAGAHDVFLVPIIMKKSRPAIQLKILCQESDINSLEALLLHETSSLGIRHYKVNKSMLKRNILTLDTVFGPIRVKEGIFEKKTVKFKAEYDDCVLAAKKGNVKLQDVYNEVNKLMLNR